MSLKLRLLLTIIPLVFVSILLYSFISWQISVDETTTALEQTAEEKLTIERVQTREAITEYLGFLQSQISDQAQSTLIAEAAQAFIPAYNQYASQRGTLSTSERDQLGQYYAQQFAAQYEDRNRRKPADLRGIQQALSPAALALQVDYIAKSSHPLGEKDKLDQAPSNTDYNTLHARFHPSFRRFLNNFGYYDIFIVDAATGNVVYSVYKELDFATNLKNGPYASSGLGEAYKNALNLKAGQSYTSKLQNYFPSYEAMAGFLSSPVVVNGKTQAVLIFQMPLNVISNIMTHQQQWVDRGFGVSGETYLVNAQNLLVTESRFFLENQAGYISVLSEKYPSESVAIKEAGTSVGLQPVRSLAVNRALAGESGFTKLEDYRGVPVYSAYSPIKIGDYTYAILAEIDVDEALAAAQILRSRLLASTLITLIAIMIIAALIALWLANRLVRPLDRLGDACESLSHGDGDLTVRLAPSRVPEINRIIIPFNSFIGQVREIISGVKQDAESLASASEELSVITSQSEEATQRQRDETHMVATSMEELSASISDVSRATAETKEFGDRAMISLNENRERADVAAKNIRLLVNLIKDSSAIISSLKGEVGEITSVLNVITGIADQTNLLALNAAIEAARAGEAGRGFSVVADEVRALATRSQENTVQIGKVIERMTQSSEKSVMAMEKAATAADGGIQLVEMVTSAMAELGETVEQVQAMSESVASATEEQEVTARSVSENVTRISQMASDIETGAQHTSSSAAELTRIAAHSHELVGRFKVG